MGRAVSEKRADGVLERLSSLGLGLFDNVSVLSLVVFRILWGYCIWSGHYMEPNKDILLTYVKDAVDSGHDASWGGFISLMPYKYWWCQALMRASIDIFTAYPSECTAALLYMKLSLNYLGALILVGFFTRTSAFTFVLFYGYFFITALSQNFVNHYYMKILVTSLLVTTPSGNSYSVSAFLWALYSRLRHRQQPELHLPWLGPQTCEKRHVWILRFIVLVVYWFGGTAKITVDWLRAMPWRTFMLQPYRQRQWTRWTIDLFLGGSTEAVEFSAYFISIMGIIFDCGLALVLLYLIWRPFSIEKRQSILLLTGTVLANIYFHCSNYYTTQHIGQFPILIVSQCSLFFPFDWPLRFIRETYRQIQAFSILPVRVGPAATETDKSVSKSTQHRRKQKWTTKRIIVIVVILLFASWQLYFPNRKVFREHRGLWDSETHNFAWQMMMLDFDIIDGSMTICHPQTNATLLELPVEQLQLADSTSKLTLELRHDVDVLVAIAHDFASRIQKSSGIRPKVYAQVVVSLNGRNPSNRLKPGVDLAAEPLAPQYRWFLENEAPLTEELKSEVFPNFYCDLFFC